MEPFRVPLRITASVDCGSWASHDRVLNLWFKIRRREREEDKKGRDCERDAEGERRTGRWSPLRIDPTLLWLNVSECDQKQHDDAHQYYHRPFCVGWYFVGWFKYTRCQVRRWEVLQQFGVLQHLRQSLQILWSRLRCQQS